MPRVAVSVPVQVGARIDGIENSVPIRVHRLGEQQDAIELRPCGEVQPAVTIEIEQSRRFETALGEAQESVSGRQERAVAATEKHRDVVVRKVSCCPRDEVESAVVVEIGGEEGRGKCNPGDGRRRPE